MSSSLQCYELQHTRLLCPSLCPCFLKLMSIELVMPSNCCRKGGPFQGPKLGSCLNSRKWIVRGDTCADKARDFIGKGPPGGEQESQGTQENCSATWLAVLGFMVLGLVSKLSLAIHSDSESFLVVYSLFSQDRC